MELGTWDLIARVFYGLFGGLVAGLYCGSANAASFEEDLQVQIFRYATETSPTFYLSSKSVFLTDNFLMKIDGYFESGSKGAWSLDPDPVRGILRLDDAGDSYFFVGRNHPLNFVRNVPVEPTSALGTVWAQNQLEALNPRVSGWIGGGLVLDLEKQWKFVAAYSPVFIPTFGPSLGFTDRGEMNPSRFARLPPTAASIGGIITPIRYKIEVGQLSELLFQHQAMLALSHDDEDVNLDGYVYTAPRPNPAPDPQAAIGVNAFDVNAKVNVNVQFPREYFTGMRAQFKKVVFEPAVEYVQALDDLAERYVSLTGYFQALRLNPNLVRRTGSRASFGFLTHIGRQFDSPTFSDAFLFARVPVALTNTLEWRTMVQTTLLEARRSFYWINELEWSFSGSLSVLGAVRILTGEDDSYFGDWRDQDSYSAGVRYIL